MYTETKTKTMKILRNIIFGLLALLILLLVAALFIDKHFVVVREVTINKPKMEVFNYVKIIRNSTYYNHWWLIDPKAKLDFKGNDGTVGFIATWDSDNNDMGAGDQEVKKVVDGERVDCALRFRKPFVGEATTYMALEAVNDKTTKLKWAFESDSHYPMNMMNLMMGKMLGGYLEESELKLKTILEK